jgi:hypothetical protein
VPGLNLFRALPKDMLSARGNVWLVSSSPTQVSYEDQRLGGVFTHFFLEALERAEPDGPGITLERIWNYARSETVIYTTARDRPQTPKQIVSKLESSAPIYFSFPSARDARPVLSASVRGRFLLAYQGGHVSELIEKQEGETVALDVYPGRARLLFVAPEGRTEHELELRSRSVTRIEETAAPQQPPTFHRVGHDAVGERFRRSTIARDVDLRRGVVHARCGLQLRRVLARAARAAPDVHRERAFSGRAHRGQRARRLRRRR